MASDVVVSEHLQRWASMFVEPLTADVRTAILNALMEAEGRERRLARWRGDPNSLNVLNRDAKPVVSSRYFPIFVPLQGEAE